MSAIVLSSRKIPFYAVTIIFLITSASAVYAYDWNVYFPADVAYAKCEITAYGSGGYSNQFNIAPGQTIPSHFTNNISYLEGRCNMASWGPTYYTRIQGRTCDGTDYKDSVMGGKSCPNNVNVKICKKGDGVGEWSHGFCPN